MFSGLARWGAAIALFASLLIGSSTPAAARFQTLPPGWVDEVAQDHWLIASPSDERGGVLMLIPVKMPFEGSLASWLGSIARQFAEIFVADPTLTAPVAPRQRVVVVRDAAGRIRAMSDRSLLTTTYGGRGRDGDTVVQVFARQVDQAPSSTAVGRSAQLVFIVAKAAVAAEASGPGAHWSTATAFASQLLVDRRFTLSAELLANAGATDAPPTPRELSEPASKPAEAPAGASPPAAQAVTTTPPPPAAAPAVPPPSAVPPQSIWSARANSDGLEIVSPCSTDGVSVVGAVRRETAWASVGDLPGVLVDEAKTILRTWTGGLDVAIENIEVQGNLAHGVAWFSTQGTDLVAWFAVTHWQGNLVGRGHVIAPAGAAQDARVGQAIGAVKDMLLNRAHLGLDASGTPPAPGTQTDVEAVMRLSGLGYSITGARLIATPVPITLYANGMALDPRGNMQGRWRRFPGGFTVEFDGAAGYVARLSESCRTAATVAGQAPWQAAPAPAPTSPANPANANCGYKWVRVTNYPIYCGNVTIGGMSAPATCPSPTSERRYEWTCE